MFYSQLAEEPEFCVVKIAMERLIPAHLQGTIFSFTVIREEEEQIHKMVPYVLALVDLELDGGGTRRVTTRITDLDPNRMSQAGVLEQVAIGDRVELITRKLGEDGERGPLKYAFSARHLIGEER